MRLCPLCRDGRDLTACSNVTSAKQPRVLCQARTLAPASAPNRPIAVQGAAVTASDISAAMVNEASRRYQAALAAGEGAASDLRLSQDLGGIGNLRRQLRTEGQDGSLLSSHGVGRLMSRPEGRSCHETYAGVRAGL